MSPLHTREDEEAEEGHWGETVRVRLPPYYKGDTQGVSVCAAAEQSQIPLTFPDLNVDWGLEQYVEARSTNQKGPRQISAVDSPVSC